MGMDRSMMQGPQGSPSKPKEVPPEETAAKIVEQMKPEVNLDELQAIAITNVLADSMREQGVLLKNESSTIQLLRLIVLSPELIITVPTILLPFFSEYFQHPFLPAFSWVILDSRSYLSAGKFFKIAKYITQIMIFG